MIFDGIINKLDLIGVTFSKVIIKNIKKIPKGIFENKEIEEVIIEEGTEIIEEYAFANNKIKKIKLPQTLKIIEGSAFENNNIKEIELNENLQEIHSKAFFNNQIKQIELKNQIKHLGLYVFSKETIIIYKNKKINIKQIEQYEGNNFFNLYNKIIKAVPDFDINKVDIEIITLLEENISKIKEYWYNKNHFEKLYENIKIQFKNTNIEKLFKISYILGYFKTSNEKKPTIEQLIKQLYLENENNNEQDLIEQIDTLEYYPNLVELIKNYYEDQTFKSIFIEYYNNYNKINKIIEKRKKENKNKNKKITYQDILEYFNNKFETKNENLKKIISLLAPHITKQDFKIVEQLYENANKKSYFEPLKGKINEYEYEWLQSQDERHFILGYLTNCCYRINGLGQDILVQSIINPQIKTMIITHNNKIIGKTTAYYNKNYLLFNNIEISNQFLNKATKKEKEQTLKVILIGINEQIKIMNKKNYNIENVRIGMRNNDLEEEIKKYFKIEKINLYENYEYKNYDSDANTEKGQAIIERRKLK